MLTSGPVPNQSVWAPIFPELLSSSLCRVWKEKLLFEALEGRRFKLGDIHTRIPESLHNLIALHAAQSKPDQAEEWRAKLPKAENTRK